MTPIAKGRIAVWEGGSLWAFDVPPGDIDRNKMHAHHAIQVTFALDGEFKLHLRDRVVSGAAAIVAADAEHAFEALGAVGLLFVAPESRAGRALTKVLDGEPAVVAGQFANAAAEIEAAFRAARDPLGAMRDVGQKLTARMAGSAHIIIEPDRRVRKMIQWASDHLDTALGANEAAAHVGLSVSRASHLFVEQTGLPFRTFVLWLRLMRAVDAYATGASLTAAAQEAGFADSAHLSRTFRRMFGLPAASLEMS